MLNESEFQNSVQQNSKQQEIEQLFPQEQSEKLFIESCNDEIEEIAGLLSNNDNKKYIISFFQYSCFFILLQDKIMNFASSCILSLGFLFFLFSGYSIHNLKEDSYSCLYLEICSQALILGALVIYSKGNLFNCYNYLFLFVYFGQICAKMYFAFYAQSCLFAALYQICEVFFIFIFCELIRVQGFGIFWLISIIYQIELDNCLAFIDKIIQRFKRFIAPQAKTSKIQNYKADESV